MKRYLLLIFPLFFSCSSSKSTKTLDFGEFSIEVPKNWKSIEENGVDSYVGKIAIDETDTLSFDLGWYSNSLQDEQVYLIENGKVYLQDVKKPSSYNLYGNADTTDFKKFEKTERTIEIIDNRKAEIIKPKKSGFGITGIYVDSIWKSGTGIDKFQLNGNDLKPENEKLFLEVIKTLKFKK